MDNATMVRISQCRVVKDTEIWQSFTVNWAMN